MEDFVEMGISRGNHNEMLMDYIKQNDLKYEFNTTHQDPFRDVYIGMGKTHVELLKIAEELKKFLPNRIVISKTTNKEHPNYGKPFVEVHSVYGI